MVDLFSGCGLMSLGLAEACRALGLTARPVLAVDVDKVALDVYARNFRGTRTHCGPVEDLLDSGLTSAEDDQTGTESPGQHLASREKLAVCERNA